MKSSLSRGAPICRVHRRRLGVVPVRRALVDTRAGALMRAGERGVVAVAMLETVARLVDAPSGVTVRTNS